jgi:glucose/arabinose dehydrogenase
VRHPLFNNHNGGNLVFGPDGKLYVGTGDGGFANDPFGHGQDRSALLGKMLRLDVDAPGRPTPEVLMIGLRNPWRYAFDRKSGDLYIADVGQDRYEEVDVVPAGSFAGRNFGWKVTEGLHCRAGRTCDTRGMTPPVVEYNHQAGCSITGGFVYRGKALPQLDGVYFYADYCTALVRSFRMRAGHVVDAWDWRATLDPQPQLANIASFGEDADGELYIVSLDGVVWALRPGVATHAAQHP